MCNVCHGTPGLYPVINRYGQWLYDIPCPECSAPYSEETPRTDTAQKQLFAPETDMNKSRADGV